MAGGEWRRRFAANPLGSNPSEPRATRLQAFVLHLLEQSHVVATVVHLSALVLLDGGALTSRGQFALWAKMQTTRVHGLGRKNLDLILRIVSGFAVHLSAAMIGEAGLALAGTRAMAGCLWQAFLRMPCGSRPRCAAPLTGSGRLPNTQPEEEWRVAISCDKAGNLKSGLFELDLFLARRLRSRDEACPSMSGRTSACERHQGSPHRARVILRLCMDCERPCDSVMPAHELHLRPGARCPRILTILPQVVVLLGVVWTADLFQLGLGRR